MQSKLNKFLRIEGVVRTTTASTTTNIDTVPMLLTLLRKSKNLKKEKIFKYKKISTQKWFIFLDMKCKFNKDKKQTRMEIITFN